MTDICYLDCTWNLKNEQTTPLNPKKTNNLIKNYNTELNITLRRIQISEKYEKLMYNMVNYQ